MRCMKTKFFLLWLLSFLVIACEEEENSVSRDDNYQEDNRAYKSTDLSYRLAEGTKLLSPYQKEQIIDAEGDTVVYFRWDTDSTKLPQKGDIYFSAPSPDVCPEGFWGKIASVDKTDIGYKVQTKLVPLSEIFQEFAFTSEVDLAEAEGFRDGEGNVLDNTNLSYVTVDSTYIEGEDTQTISNLKTRAVQEDTFAVRTLPWNFELDILKISGSCEVGSKARIDYRMPDYLRIDLEPFANINCSGQIEFANKEIGYDQTKKMLGQLARVPITVNGFLTGFSLSVHVVGYMEASVTATTNAELNIKYSYPYSFIMNGREKSFEKGKPVSNSTSLKFESEGSASLTAGLRFMIGLDCLGIPICTAEDLYVDGNLCISADMSLKEDKYEAIKDAKANLGLTVGAYAELMHDLNLGTIDGEEPVIGVDYTWNLATYYLYPKITDWKSIQNDAKAAVHLYSTLSRNMLLPVKVGYQLFDANGILIDKFYANEKYWMETGFSNPMTTTYYDLIPGETYTVYPFVQYPFSGMEIVATDGYKFTVKEEEIEVTPGDAIDMGGSVLWARANVGANSPQTYGRYFLYDEVEASLDDGWRVPTIEEWNELLNDCNWEYRGFASKYVVLTSRKTNNVLLIPGTGFKQGSQLHKPYAYFYWLGEPTDKGRSSVQGDIDYITEPVDPELYYRFPVRAVKDKK